MDCVDDTVNGLLIHHNSDWSGEVILIWNGVIGTLFGKDQSDSPSRECRCQGKDLIAGRFTPRAGDPEPPTNVLTRAVALAVETYLRAKAVRAAENLFIERRKL